MIWVITLHAVAAVLPTIGFIRLLARATEELRKAETKIAERGASHMTFDDLDEMLGVPIDEGPRRLIRDLTVDITLVGGGLAAGAAASIWSLFL